MKSAWKDAPLSHRIVTTISILTSLSVVVLAVLQIVGVWKEAVDICIPLLGVIMLCQAYTQWKTNRKSAYVSIAAAVIILICAVAVFFIR